MNEKFNHTGEINLKKTNKVNCWLELDDLKVSKIVTINTYNILLQQNIKMLHLAFNDDIIYLHNSNIINKFEIITNMDDYMDSSKYYVYELFNHHESRKETHIMEK